MADPFRFSTSKFLLPVLTAQCFLCVRAVNYFIILFLFQQGQLGTGLK